MATLTEMVAAVVVHSSAAAFSHFGVTFDLPKVEQRNPAVERVVAFLMDFAARAGAGWAFELPMTRQDLADYLGLTIHTVSRTLSQLEASGLIEARSSRMVRLLQPACLEGMLE